MAEGTVLIVSEKINGFTVNALETALENCGVKTIKTSVVEAKMSSYVQSSEIVLIADDSENILALNNLRKDCKELEKPIVLYGENNAIVEMEHLFEGSNVALSFKRPIEVVEVAEKVSRLLERIEHSNDRKKILVVDDNGVMLRTILGWLEGQYEVSLANSATGAFAAIERNRPDLILLDYEMPVCSGAQFMEMLAIEETTKDIPVIFLTSRNDSDTVIEVMKLKPKGYILKSTPQEQVINTINNFFAQNLI